MSDKLSFIQGCYDIMPINKVTLFLRGDYPLG